MSACHFFVGVDFGTSRSGFAFAPLNSDTVKLKVRWPGGDLAAYPKALTALLYNKSTWEAEYMGWEAMSKYQDMTKADRDKYLYLERFKLALADDSTVELPAPLTAVKCVADYLRLLLVEVDAQMKMLYPGDIYSRSKVKWCLTVPGGWSDSAKHAMRQAAVQAGMVDSLSSDRLEFLHEPEAAVLAIRASMQKEAALKGGDSVLVIDAGGGTVDLTMHEVQQTKNGGTVLRELAIREMELAGATYIDERFEALVKEKVTEDAYEEWLEKAPHDRIALMYNNWETQKQQHGSQGPNDLVVPFPNSLVRKIPYEFLDRLQDEQDGEDDRLHLRRMQTDELFDPSVHKTLAAAKRIIKNAGRDPDRIFVVGGFGSSQYLVDQIREAFSPIPVFSPPNAPSAIMEGAVLHALNPSTITSRRSRLSYGIRHCRPWSDDCPAGTKVEYSQEDGGPRCNARFSKYITIGEDVEVESEAVHTFHPITRTQTSVAFDIFGVPRKDAKWTTEPGMVKVGTVEISIKGTIHNAYDYDLRAVMKFGTATIEVRVTDMQTGMTARSEVVFSAS